MQKDLNTATQALEDVALESANVAKEVIPKEVFNPLAKFTKVSFNIFLFLVFSYEIKFSIHMLTLLSAYCIIILKGIQHFGDSVLNPNKKEKEFDDINPQDPASTLNPQHFGAPSHDQPVGIPSTTSPNISRSGSNNAFQQDYMAAKISESSSCTQVLLL